MQAQICSKFVCSMLLSDGRGGGCEALVGCGYACHPPLAAATHDCSRAVIQIENDVIIFLLKAMLQVLLCKFHLIWR